MPVHYSAADAKAYFASERTFLHWLSVAVTLGGLAAGLLGISGHAHGKWGPEYEASSIAVRMVGLCIMAIAIVVAIMSTWNFRTRKDRLRALSDGPYDSRWLPLTVSVVMVLILLVVWVGSVLKLAEGG